MEPDVLLHFEHALVLVEVKPPAGNDQSTAQWQRQLQALSWRLAQQEAQECADEESSERNPTLAQHARRQRVEFLALGRNHAISASDAQQLQASNTGLQFSWRLHQREWRSLLQGLVELRESLQALPCTARSDLAVLTDWLQALELYGLWPAPRLHFAQLQSWLQPVTTPNDAQQSIASGVDQRSWQALLQWSAQHAHRLPRHTN